MGLLIQETLCHLLLPLVEFNLFLTKKNPNVIRNTTQFTSTPQYTLCLSQHCLASFPVTT